MTDNLTAAVARLREHLRYLSPDHAADVYLVLSALEAAQADARRGKALADALRDNYYCECCDRAPAKSVQIALAAIDAAMGEEK